MRLDNEFVVPRPVDEAWTVLTDVERVAPCMPGAQLTEVVGDSYHGTVKVKVGPVVAQYGGAVRFTEMDPERHHVVLEAKGKERNGRGLASALVTADLAGDGDGTRVTVRTELTISGPLAQFGRGAIAEVSSRLLNQFVDRLKETVLQDGGAPTSAAPAAPAAPATTDPPAAPAAPVAPAVAPVAVAGGGTVAGETAPAPRSAAAPEATAPGVAAPEATAPGAAAPGAGSPPAGAPEAGAPANLLRVAAVPILKRLLPPLIVIIALIVVLIVWLG
jgi:carbon monoxide dehydrogenase subunit G